MQKTIDFRIVVITDTFFEVNGIGSYYRTLLDWCRRTRGGNYTIVCPRRDDLAQGDVADDVIPIDPAIPVPNWLYKDLPLGIYSSSAVCKVLKSIPGPKVIHVATSGMLGAAGAGLGVVVDPRRCAARHQRHVPSLQARLDRVGAAQPEPFERKSQ